MTTEEKNLLIKDICARLPYDVEAEVSNYIEGESKPFVITKIVTFNDVDAFIKNEVVIGIKPLLRPLSSLTDEEKEQLHIELCDDIREEDNGRHTEIYGYTIVYHDFKEEEWYIPYESVDWLNSNHFDYRGLIPMGLAIETSRERYITQ